MNSPGRTAAPRLESLDAFRGFAIAGMVLVNNPGDWGAIHAPLAHASWHGWTFTDTIFPFFLFIVGTSMAISFAARAQAGATRAALLAGMARRAAVIFAIGLALNAVPQFDWAQLRIPGVLQRIALASLLAAPVVLACRGRGQAIAIVALFAVYSALMLAVPVPDAQGVVAAGVLEPGRDFGAWLDRSLLGGHLWSASRTWDPEGLTSTLPAVGTVLFGALAGRALAWPVAPWRRVGALAAAGLALLAAGLVLDRVLMPINKNLWTPSYAVFMAGWSLLVLAAFHGAIEAAPQPAWRRWASRLCRPLVIYGVNAIAIFVLSGLVARLMAVIRVDGGARSLKSAAYEPIRALPLAPADASLLWALLFNLAMFTVAWVLWKRRWFIKV